MNKDFLMEMEKEQLVDYINFMFDVIGTLENRLQDIKEYVDMMSFCDVVDNPKKDLYRILKGEEQWEKIEPRTFGKRK